MMRQENEMNTSISSVLNTATTFLHALPTTRKGKTPLPIDFIPHSYSVILGRGKVNETIGNRRLKILVEIELQNYVKAQSRREKGYVVARVMETIQDAGGEFIRHEGGRWFEVDDSDAREKISTLFRDKLSHQYKSSTSNKVKRRRQRKEEMRSSTTNKNNNNKTTIKKQERESEPLFEGMDSTRMHTSFYMDSPFSDCISTISV